MINDLVDICELMVILGYSDERSLKKWCQKQHIGIISLGLKKYVPKHLLTQYIDNQVFIFVVDKKVGKINSETENDTQIKPAPTKERFYPATHELIAKYLNKYESKHKSKPSK